MTRCTATITGRLEGAVRVTVDLAWDSADPHAVQLAIRVPGFDVARIQVLSRHTLACGLTKRHGEGRVTVEPIDGDKIRIALRSPEAETAVDLDEIPVWIFLRDTEKYVKCGKEDITAAIDDAIRRCLTQR